MHDVFVALWKMNTEHQILVISSLTSSMHELVSWSLTSLFSTNMAISETKYAWVANIQVRPGTSPCGRNCGCGKVQFVGAVSKMPTMDGYNLILPRHFDRRLSRLSPTALPKGMQFPRGIHVRIHAKGWMDEAMTFLS